MAEAELKTEIPELPDVVVKVEAEASPAPDVTVKTDGDPAVKDLVEQYKALEAKSAASDKEKAEANERAAVAQREADAAKRDAETARAAATSSNLDTITQALATAQALADAAKRDKKSARESGDFDAESEADERLIQARIDIRTYDEARSNLEARKTAQPVRDKPTDPVEAYARGREPQTAEWLRQHRDYVIDPRKNAKLTAGHHDAVAEGIKPDTPEYFEHVEKFIGLTKEPDKVVTAGDDVQRPGAAPTKKPAQRSVAPVANSSANGGGAGSKEVRLTPGEAKAADDGTHVWGKHDLAAGRIKDSSMVGRPIGLQEMARRKYAMDRQGLYDKVYYEQ